ncbi:hypothetical protein GR927_34460 [Mycolicibacterium sp. 3033]|nr:hypothetical protein [Mycolicibacterium aurantiacum]
MLVLALAGCAQGDAPNDSAADTSSAAAYSAPTATKGSPTPSAVPSPELEAAIRATAPDYTVASVGDAGPARYVAARTDLNADGNDETFVYLMGPYFCGSGGCTLLVFDHGVDGYSLLATMTTSSLPVIVSPSTTNDYADLWRMQSGGGAPAEFVHYVFSDGRYVEQSRRPADEVPEGTTVLPEGTDFAEGLVLEPRA